MNKKSLIVGSGGIGSRHLQGILKSSFIQDIYVYDISKSSLEICRTRELEINHSNHVKYLDNWDDLPLFFDLIIISTSSNVRYKIFKDIINDFSFKNLILEKVLFQSPAEYDLVKKILPNFKNSNFWINLPRRESLFYSNLKSRFNKNNSIMSVDIFGENWGLSCNSLHFIDLICYLTDSNIISINTSGVSDKIMSSKRAGFIEFTGSIDVKLKNNVIVRINSSEKTTSINRTIFINISSSKENIFISEGECRKPQAIIQSKENPDKFKKVDFNLKFQSELSTDISNQLFENNHCSLSNLEASIDDHKIFIESFLSRYNQIKSISEFKIPIT